ncbi:MAG: long-chain fatty acid--CoA ligase [Candidatus Omnitrophota bacterium]|nr:long-chain fatty acid--CoA ligase [Candidatus Omnitrophota bacterium]
MREDTIPLMFFARANKYTARCALKVKREGRYRDISWLEFESKVKNLAYGLLTLGLKPGDKVALLSENRPEWAYSDLAVLSLGCADVPLYPTDVAHQIGYILADSDSKIVIVSNRDQLDKILAVKAKAPALQKIIVMDPPSEIKDKDIISLESVLRSGAENASNVRLEFEARVQSTTKGSLASIIYTSGTTGEPKGVCLTHDNFLSNCRSCLELLPLGEEDIALSFLPLSHVFERMASYYFTVFIGGTIAYAENMDSLQRNLREVRPTYVCSAPRFYEKMYINIMNSVAQSPPFRQHLFNRSLAIAKKYIEQKLNRIGVDPVTWFWYHMAKAFIFSKVREAVGGRIKFFISGGAPLSKELAEFLYSVGMIVLEGYGLTETSPVVSCNTLKAFKFGSVGRPVKDVEVRIAADGEILVSGPSVMKEYYKKEKETKEALNSDGWLHTGDIGFIDEEGFLRITDRKKDIIITASGKNLAPQPIENLFKSDSYLQEVILHGDKRPYLTALVVPNFDALKGLALRQGIPYVTTDELVRHPRVYEFIAKRIEEKQKDLANYEKVKKFALLDRGLTIEEGEITPTLKVKRRVIAERYKKILDNMYEV